MEINEIKKEVTSIEKKFNEFFSNIDIDKINSELDEMNLSINKEDFWTDNQKASLFIKTYNEKKEYLNNVTTIYDKIVELKFMIIEFPEEIENLEVEFKDLKNKYKNFEIEQLLSDKYDDNPAILEIHPGAGGVESHDFAYMIYDMYIKFFEKDGYKYKILDMNSGEVAGIKSVTVEIHKKNVYGILKGESGVHRLIRISPFDSGARRHTSFASVKVSPLITETNFTIDENDLKIDTYRSSGAGGQSVNTTDSAVRITHLPTKIVVTCQNERSQIKNKEIALGIMKSKLQILEETKREEEKAAQIGKLDNNGFGSQKRSYILHPYKMAKDHETKFETSQVQKVLMGEIEDFLYENLLFKNFKGE